MKHPILYGSHPFEYKIA